jgi:hypothetical protein
MLEEVYQNAVMFLLVSVSANLPQKDWLQSLQDKNHEDEKTKVQGLLCCLSLGRNPGNYAVAQGSVLPKKSKSNFHSDVGNKTLKPTFLYLKSVGFKYEKCDG